MLITILTGRSCIGHVTAYRGVVRETRTVPSPIDTDAGACRRTKDLRTGKVVRGGARRIRTPAEEDGGDKRRDASVKVDIKKNEI